MPAKKSQKREARPEVAPIGAIPELLDRYLAGDLSNTELAGLAGDSVNGPTRAEWLRPAISFEALMRDTLDRCARGGQPASSDATVADSAPSSADSIGTLGRIVEDSECADATVRATSDLSLVDRYLVGLASRSDVDAELARSGRDSGLEAELHDALAYERLLRASLTGLADVAGVSLSREAEQVDRMMAGDLDAAEQAEFIAHTPAGSQSGRALREAVACSELIRESLRLLAAGATERKARNEAVAPGPTLLDDLLDRSLAGALKQSEIAQLAAAAESSPAAAARVRSADKYATLMQTSLARMACGSDRANELMERATFVRLPQGSHARRAAKGRILRFAPAARARGIKIAAAAVFLLAGASAAVWAVLDGLHQQPSGGETVAQAGSQDTPAPTEGGDGSGTSQVDAPESGREGSDTADVGSGESSSAPSDPVVDSSQPRETDPTPSAGQGEGSSASVDGGTPDAGSDPNGTVDGVHPDPTTVNVAGDGGEIPTAGGSDSDAAAPIRKVEVLLSPDTLESKLEAIDVGRRHLLSLQRDDGLFAIIPEPDAPTADEGRRARRAANRISDEARVEDSASMQATCLRALVQSLGSDSSVVAAQSVGVDSLLRLAKEKLSFGLLNVRDAANVLCAVDAWYQAMARSGAGRAPSSAHSKEATELLRFILRQQKPNGLWGHGKPQQAYGLPTDEQGLSAQVGRQVEADLASTFAAAQGIDAASRLKVRVNVAQASLKLVTAILNAQSPQGEAVSLPQLAWDAELCVAIDEGREAKATARGWSITGDHQSVSGKPLERSGLATASALFALQVGRAGLSTQDRTKRMVTQIDRSLADGFAWLAANFDAASNPRSGQSGVVSKSTQQYASLWRVAVREASARRGYTVGGGQLVLGGAAWYRSLNDAVVPMLVSGMGETPSASLDVGFKPTSSNKRLGRALSIAHALLAINSSDLLLPDGRAIVE